MYLYSPIASFEIHRVILSHFGPMSVSFFFSERLVLHSISRIIFTKSLRTLSTRSLMVSSVRSLSAITYAAFCNTVSIKVSEVSMVLSVLSIAKIGLMGLNGITSADLLVGDTSGNTLTG